MTATSPAPAGQGSVPPVAAPPKDRPVGHAGTRVEIDEHTAWQVSGLWALLGASALAGVAAWQVIRIVSLEEQTPSNVVPAAVLAGVCGLLALLVLGSLTVVAPGRTNVVQFFGRYVGTARRTGLVWLLPLTTRRGMSVRVRNFETSHLKVNDADGNPVDIAAIVVWQVADTAKATFAVEDYTAFVEIQAEAALRHVATTHPYDSGDPAATSLRGSTDEVAGELAVEVAERVAVAGVEILEVRISHLAYAQEVAQAMLQRQQAGAIVAARERIVDGAVGMVRMALDKLADEAIVDLDDERKAAMVSNLLVVLCGDSRATPVVNTGTLYS
ncbi:SPFH domain-containing protein [Motilibacter aurantiacus]|uniref:SPFH domain-containing protein n=1 Tax=Motilibacter aurantiacus TaxID=2714955 RepID=UPI00140E0038|nr:SPFH domain-containing protein [Motilibacter aurantiacus]NHC44786.1 SPFH domain-containing protein [Motilibacter aurantiacus]